MDNIESQDCQEKCGNIYFTSHGNLIIYCTLCENKFKCYDIYATHVKDHIITSNHFGREENEFFELENTTSTNIDYSYNSNSMPEHEDSEINKISDGESEDMYAIVEFERADNGIVNQSDEEDLTCESFIHVERLDISNENENDDDISNNEKSEEESSPTAAKKYTRRLQQRSKLVSNLDKRDKNHKCPHCDFACSDRSNLLGHIKRHSNNKPHKCEDCGKRFYTRTELKAHMRSHTGERPFLCMECGKGFSASSKLTLHLKRHANLRDKECPMCEMKFYNASRLREHMTIHSEERPLKCNVCDASFKVHSSLRNHEKLHKNEKKYKCPLCPASFNQNSGLYSHMKKRHSVVKNLENEIELKIERDYEFIVS